MDREPIYVFEYSGQEQFEILMDQLEPIGYKFISQKGYKTTWEEDEGILAYVKNYSYITLYQNSDRLYFSSNPQAFHKNSTILTFLAPYTQEIKDVLINNLK